MSRHSNDTWEVIAAQDLNVDIVLDDAGVAEKKVCWLKLTTEGTEGHGSMPPKDNANFILTRALGKIADYETPVTVKLRSGWTQEHWVDVEFARIAEQCGAAAVTLHPRSKTMGFSGHSLWERIALVKQTVTIPVIGNGDIRGPEDATAMLEQTGCDSVMIGRAAMGNPWVFRSVKQALMGEPVTAATPQDRLSTALEHLTGFRDAWGESIAAKELKKHMAWYVRSVPGAASLRRSLFTARTTNELESAMSEFFEKARDAMTADKE